MRRRTNLSNMIATIVFLLPVLALSQPNISGDLTGSLGPGEYIVVGDCNVPSGETLTIEPGTSFLFSGHYKLDIYGTLAAIGTVEDSIIFRRQLPIEDHKWGGINFQEGASPNSIIEYCYISNCKKVVFPDYYGGGIYSDGVDLTIRHSIISDCEALSGVGICVVSNANLTIDNCMFCNNTTNTAFTYGGGIYVDGGALTLTNSTISSCDAGTGSAIYCIDNSAVIIDSCTLFNNNTLGSSTWDEEGVVFCSGGVISLSNTSISDCEGSGVYILGGDDVTIINCIFCDNIAANGGGIALESCNDSRVMNSTIARNSSEDG